MTGDPTRLRAVGATDLERRLLEAGASERPEPELTRRMQKALGLSAAAGVTAATAAAGAAVITKTVTRAVFWARLSSGLLAVAVAGGVIGANVRTRSSATRAPAAAPAAVQLSTPPLAPPEEGPAAAGAERAHPHATRVLRAHHARPHALVAARELNADRTSNRDQDLRGEIALVDAARAALRAGAPERALALLQRHGASYRDGTLQPEAAALRIEALAALGRGAEARALSRRFVAEHPDSPLSDRVVRAATSAN